MKKRNLILAIILSLVLNLGFVMSSTCAVFNVSVGESYTYEIVEAKMYAKVGRKSASGAGLLLGNHQIEVGSSIKYNITSINELGVFWTLTHEDYSWHYVSDPEIDLMLLECGYTSALTLPISIYDTFNATKINLGMFMPYFSPFLDVDNWDNITNSHQYMDLFADRSPDIVKEFSAQTNASGYFIEAAIYGSLYANVVNFDYDVYFNNQLLLIFDTNGIMQGIKINAWINGNFDGKKVNISMEYQLELVDYDLPEFQFTGLDNEMLGIENGFLISTSAICSIAVVAIIIRKKRK